MPKVSVVVPIYNVEEYLEECLNSLVCQTLDDLEVIMVNDGSTDSSGEIMDQYALKHSHFKAYHKENGGLGQARNYGVRFATGQFLAFLDSDDYVASDAYEKMYDAALKNNSDMVVGNVERFNSTKIYASGLHKKIFRDTEFNTHIKKKTELLYDTTAWNKLFKKSFWDRHQFQFPEGILYEDLPVTIPAHYLSASTDVLSDVIYYWRARDGGDRSITQQRDQLKNFEDRLAVVQMVDQFFEEQEIEGILKKEKEFKALNLDFLLYLNQLDLVDEEYQNVFIEKISNYLSGISPYVVNKLNAIDRLKYYLVQYGEREKLIHVIKFQKNRMKTTKIIKDGTDFYGNYPYRDVLPAHLYKLNQELKAVPKIESCTWHGNQLKIRGYNYIPKIDLKEKRKISLEATLINPLTNTSVDIPVKMVKRRDITHKHGIAIKSKLPLKRLYCYDWSGYELVIDFSRIEIARLEKGQLELWFKWNVDGLIKEFRAGGPLPGKRPRPSYNTGIGQRVFVKYTKKWDLIIQTDVLTSAIENADLIGNYLTVKGWSVYPLEESSLKVVNYSDGITHTFPLGQTHINGFQEIPNARGFQCDIHMSQFENVGNLEWVCYFDFDGERYPLTVPKHVKLQSYPRESREARVEASPAGNLIIDYQPHAPYLKGIEWEKSRLKLRFHQYDRSFDEFSEITELRVSFQHTETGNVLTAPCYEIRTRNYLYRSFISEVNLTDASERHVFEAGDWEPYFEIHGKHGEESHVVKKRMRVENRRFKFKQNVKSGIRLTPYRTGKGDFIIKAALEWGWLEQGPRRQEIIQKVLYPFFRLLPMKKKTVVFESYWGKSYSCNPRAIYEYMEQQGMDYHFIWFLNNENTPVEGKAKPVRKYSWRYYYYLATAKYFINNVNFPDLYEKRKGAVEVQTLHGTFLKTMGLDVPGEVDTEEKLHKFMRRCKRWDYLVSPSRYMTHLSKRCFDYQKEMLECGFPRNDVLQSPSQDTIAHDLKEKLGLPPDKKVILYAPTWRVKNSFNVELDLRQMQEKLGDEYIILLRLHYFTASAIDVSAYQDFAYDMSSYPDIQELYLMSDLLITDYSSVMFDYANLNRPMLFFTYDLEMYRDRLRGLYIDLEKEAPGPLVKTNEELIDAIRNLRKYNYSYGNKLERFRRKYCEFDGGNASQQVVQAVFENEYDVAADPVEDLAEKTS